MSNKIIKLSDYNLPSVESLLEQENRVFNNSVFDLKWRHMVYSTAIKGLFEVISDTGITASNIELQTDYYFRMPLEDVLEALCGVGIPIASIEVTGDSRVHMALAVAQGEDADTLLEKVNSGDTIKYGLWLIRLDEARDIVEARTPDGWVTLPDIYFREIDQDESDIYDYDSQRRKELFEIATEHQCKILGAGSFGEQSFLECLLEEKGPISDSKYEQVKEKYFPLINVAGEDEIFIMHGGKPLLKSCICDGFAVGYENEEFIVYQHITCEDLAILGIVDMDSPDYEYLCEQEYIRKIGTTKSTDLISNIFTVDDECCDMAIPVSVNRFVLISAIDEESTYADFVEQVNDNLVSWSRDGQTITEEEMANLKPFRRWIKKYF